MRLCLHVVFPFLRARQEPSMVCKLPRPPDVNDTLGVTDRFCNERFRKRRRKVSEGSAKIGYCVPLRLFYVITTAHPAQNVEPSIRAGTINRWRLSGRNPLCARLASSVGLRQNSNRTSSVSLPQNFPQFPRVVAGFIMPEVVCTLCARCEAKEREGI